MNSKKKWLIGVLVAVINTALILAYVGYRYYEYSKAEELVMAYESVAFPNIFINDIDVSELTQEKIVEVIEKELGNFGQRKMTVVVGDQTFERSLEDFNVTFNQDIESFSKKIIEIGKDLEIMEQASQIQEPMLYEFEIGYNYDQDTLENWVKSIEEACYIEKVEPIFEMVYYGSFQIEEGSDGQLISGEQLLEQLTEQLKTISKEPIYIEVTPLINPRETDIELLKTIDTKISTYSSTYPAGIPRAKNVELAASKVNKTLLMPNDEFSYAEKVSPVDAAHGYVDATIFLNGKAVPGIGGGICQVSSTLYNTQLEAGIIATERRNHSLSVNYVPLGQDATMADNAIDLKFINTLDYPIYINVMAEYGTLTVEFWSNSEALKGITYKPKTIVSEGGLRADTTLYGYNADGEVVFEQFLHTSKYKPHQ
ncbi:vanomycin resistance protein VanB [Turicibacter sanguinis]|uniref:VanW family protein n=1 Tax=Turicibacter sanguinis TaxID=154288 RepID=UPI0012B9F75E|nr:VanW family protein [Turicibacter sanguinis]MDB8544067.1 VanW family protein [Turicibacter sanguinis]MTH05945.1 vanomycin resistance protein VanB [Turicibacter sanguinis]MTH09147.1 vanomycin resistance protein VanB [Turicibacter sanguinis]MTH11635.1 vanomycin resistance protein VanB [Turicibacter sanguinis]MTH19061.1 vanomycin resistance protein VanB [Turicibacter sanguinis]